MRTEPVAIIEARVAEARRIVERQRKIVETFRRRNMNASDAESLLVAFEKSLAIFEDELQSAVKYKK
jgi:hypothetical protein